MPIDVNNTDHYVYLKTNAFDSLNGNQVDTIPLKVNTIGVSVNRTVPSLPIPLSSLARGESETVAIDLGMASKEISINGVITSGTIRRSHTTTGSSPENQIATAVNMTAVEMAQLISSGVDSSGLAKYQNFNELVFLYESNINENYIERSSVERIPFTFASRGEALTLDNARVALPSNFPVSQTSTGLSGFISSFSFSLDSENPLEMTFDLTFVVARIFP
tara:strand:- start:8694 stop:9353 length:660 start_codon:yes stop_codon:yes gene_type:complete